MFNIITSLSYIKVQKDNLYTNGNSTYKHAVHELSTKPMPQLSVHVCCNKKSRN